MVFSLRQLQEKCREQQMPLYIAFIDLTKAFDLVSRDGLFQILPEIGCPPKLQSMIKSSHTNMTWTVQFNGSSSRPFDIRSGVKQMCVLAPTLFGIFSLLLRHAFGTASEGICLRTRSDGRLFNLGRLSFADDAAVTTHTQQELQALMDCSSQACKDLGLTISLKKINVLGQSTMGLPAITIDDYELDLVSRDGLVQILPEIGCPPKLQSMIESSHTNMTWTVQFNGSSSRPFDIRSGVKQMCVLAPTLFGIFSLLLRHAFGTASEGICLRTRSDGRLFNLSRLRAKTKVREALIKGILFADDAAVTTHTQQELQALMDRFSQACKDLGLTISLKKTNVLGQHTMELPAITIDDYELDVVEQFTYLDSTITDNLSLDTEIDKRIRKAATTLARLTSRVWTNPKLIMKTNMVVDNACVVGTLMYGSETWTTYARQEKRLNSFHLRSIRRILGISWQDRVSNTEVLS